ncbi:helicase protein MOM1 isoform X2 [Neltuma alba]|uniref:helicase protein MOM1 isoform X2 n=1 Tax=Neltuma alba TaxID=207710 RepID=UPI0010A3882D|nr:helicase protein MOM1-like isoform X2 [Prosopis alba]
MRWMLPSFLSRTSHGGCSPWSLALSPLLEEEIEFGVYSVSEGVESIWDVREVKVFRANGWTTEKHFLVKYKGLAHVHNRWVPESQLLLEAPPLLFEKFNQKDQALKWKPEWSLPHRLLQKRALIFAQQDGDPSSGQAIGNSDCHYEWLVKWHGLGYEHASWELDDALFLHSLEGRRLIKDYEDRHQRAKRVPLSSKVDKKLDRITSFSKLSQTPGGFPPGFGINNLDAVNKLREHWHKGQNAVVFDDHDRMVKMVAFISSLVSNTCRPFLIISTSAALHLWEYEFSCWAPSLNVVIYSGNKEIRRSIRKLEFYGEGGCLLFQVLIVLPEIIIEDLEVLEGLEFEAIIIDESQCSKISSYLKQIKMLKTDFWILLFSGQLKDSVVEYQDILAFLDHQSYNEDNGDLISNSSDIGQLKDKLSSFVAYRCNSDSFRFVEYWVPVNISDVQLEQYCAALLSNSSILRSQSKSHVTGALHDILTTTRKCCNHPYLVDESLQSLLIKDLPPAEILDVGVKASGKLQLLDSMLMELKKQGLRVLILFQFLGGSGRVSIGDILDDLIRQRFGPDSYERIDKGVLNSKKQSALKMFNNKEHGRFVLLLETNACHHSIKLSSVDTIIIFDSDWNPLNDIRSLQKVALDSQLEHVKIFRLYSSFTVEERALVLAKQDRPLDSKLDLSWSTSHTLLMWGASSLFDDLKAFHDGKTDILSVNSSSAQLSLKQALHEFLSILKQNGEDTDTRDCSFLLKVKQNGLKYYPNFSLLGEWKFKSLDSEPYHLFWTKVLEGKNPQWKYSCGLSQRSRKRAQHMDGLGKRSDFENEEVVKKRTKFINNADQPYSKREGEKLSAGNKEERPQGNDVEFLKARKSRDEQRSLHLSLKSEIAKLCGILDVPDNVKRMADEFLDYVMNNHHVNSTLPKSILEAFQIALCWAAAALAKHKIDHEASLMLAKQHLKFDCRKDEANVIYSMLRCLKNIFLHRTGNYNVTGSPKASASGLSDKNYSCTGLALEAELAKKDVLKSIKEIQKKCQKKLRKLLFKHQEEKNKLDATYEEKRADLEKKYKIESAVIRSRSPNDVIRSENLKNLDIEYNERIEDLKHQYEMHLKDLENVQSTARQMLQNREVAWVEDVKSWAQDELLNALPSKEHGNGIEYLKTSMQAEPDYDPKNRCLVSNLVTKDTNFDRTVEAMIGTRLGSSRTPEIMSPMLVQCGDPVDGQTPPVEAASAYEGHDRAQNVCDSQGKIISVPAHPKEHNVNGATRMMNEGEGHNIFYDGCGEKTVPDGSEKDTAVDPSSSRELIPDRSPLNVSDRELSSRQCESPPLPDQQTSLEVSLCIRDGQVPIEVPETSCGIAEGNKGGEHQRDGVLLDQTATSEEREQMSRTMNNNTLSQALQDSPASLLTSPRMVDKDATVGEIQNSSGLVEQLSNPADIIPANQCNLQSVVEPLEQVQELPSAECLASNQDTAGEMQIFAPQVEPVSSPVDALPAGQFNHDPAMEPLEQLQQLPSAAAPAANLDTSGELLNSSQQVEPVCRQDNGAQANGLNHESRVRELLQQMQQLPPAVPPNSTHNPSVATETELRSNNEDSLCGQVSPAPMEVTNQAVVHSASELDSHTPVGTCRTQSLGTRNVFTPPEINNRPRQTTSQSADTDPLKNELDRLLRESEQTLKYYEDMKLQLKSDCERELEETRRKYDVKLQERELEFHLKKKNLETNINLVLMNKMWAEAFRSKCMDLRVSGPQGMQQDPSLAQQLVWTSSQQRDVRPSQAASPPHGPPASTLQHLAAASSPQTMAPPPPVSSMRTFPLGSSQILVPPMPATASSSPMVPLISTITSSQNMAPPLVAAYNAPPRPPHINSIPPLANHQAGSGFRTTPPHLQPYRPPTSGVLSQQAPSNNPAMPSLPNHARPTLPTNTSDPHNRVQRPEIPVRLPIPNFSAREPAMGGNSQLGMNLSNTLLRPSNVTSLQQSKFGTASSMRDDCVRPAMSPNVVCLSDDD